MIRSRFFRRLFLGYTVLILLTISIIGVVVSRQIERSTRREIDQTLRSTAEILRELSRPYLLRARSGDREGAGHLEERLRGLRDRTNLRLTVILADGTVLADSRHDAASMENHGHRPEVVAAGSNGIGRAVRLSATVATRMSYLALRVDDPQGALGTVRVAISLDDLDQRLSGLRRVLLLGSLAAIIAALLLGFGLARRFVAPITRLTDAVDSISQAQYDRRVEVSSEDELAALAQAFNRMGERIVEERSIIESDRNKLRAVLTAMREGVIAVDDEQRIVHLNGAARELLDLPRDPDPVGRPVWEVIRRPELAEVFDRTLREGKPCHDEIVSAGELGDQVIEVQSSVLRSESGPASGSVGNEAGAKPGDASATTNSGPPAGMPTGTPGTTPSGAVVVLHDASRVRRLESMRRDLLSNVSHELKTPLAAIRGLVETVLDDPDMDDAQRSHFLKNAQAQVSRLSALVGDLLVLSRLDREEDRMDITELDLRAPLEDALRAHRSQAEQQQIDLSGDVGGEPLMVHADAEAMRQVADNLISNAIRYTAEGGRVVLRAGRQGERVFFEVEDTGIGIDPAHQERIFERFYRVDKARSRELGGTGLGLAIVKNVVRRLGGQVTVHSEMGRGSRFRVELPRG